jgi:hypothetical protein
MAIEIKFTGYINEIKEFSWGKIAKVAHSQVRKNDAGEWETVGRDYFDVILPEGSRVSEKDKVEVIGKLKSKTFDKKDGTKGMSLEVRAESVIASTPRSIAVDDKLPF